MLFIPSNNFPDIFFEWIESEGLADSFRPDPLEFASLAFYAEPHAPEVNDGPDHDDENDDSEWDQGDDSAENVDQWLERSIQSALADAAAQEGPEPAPTDRIQSDHENDDDSDEDVDQWLERSVQRDLAYAADQEGIQLIPTHPVQSDHGDDDSTEDVDDS